MKIVVPSLKRSQPNDVEDEAEDLVQHIDEDDDVIDSTVHHFSPAQNDAAGSIFKESEDYFVKTRRTIICRMTCPARG